MNIEIEKSSFRAYQASHANPYKVSIGTAMTFPDFSDWTALSTNSLVAGRTTPISSPKTPSLLSTREAIFA